MTFLYAFLPLKLKQKKKKITWNVTPNFSPEEKQLCASAKIHRKANLYEKTLAITAIVRL